MEGKLLRIVGKLL